MALQLPMTDRFGNEYPQGYRRWRKLEVDTDAKTIGAVFDDWKDATARGTPGLEPFRKVEYTVGPSRVPALLSYDGVGDLDEEALAAMGVTVARDGQGAVTALTQDGNPAIDGAALHAMGVTVIRPPTPSFDDFSGPDNASPTGLGSLVYAFAKSRPDNSGAIDI